mmetsp:Transcript_3590/g.6810  ORF Transcript_3590/g.6810 Transcript_3590/m.6810 type:complete len:88 (-) Transcript_3590:968-1231(-)
MWFRFFLEVLEWYCPRVCCSCGDGSSEFLERKLSIRGSVLITDRLERPGVALDKGTLCKAWFLKVLVTGGWAFPKMEFARKSGVVRL